MRQYRYNPNLAKFDFNTPFLAVDIETTGLNPRTDQVIGVAFTNKAGVGYYTNDVPAVMAAIMAGTCQIVMHNATFDFSFLKQKGWDLGKHRIHDTMLLAHLLDPDRKTLSLKGLAVELLNPEATIKDQVLKQWLTDNSLMKADLAKAPPSILVPYACEDAINTYELFQKLCENMTKIRTYFKSKNIACDPWNYYLNEVCAMIPVVADMQLGGVKLDLEATAVKKVELSKRLQELSVELSKTNASALAEAERILLVRKTKEKALKSKSGKFKLPLPIAFNWDSNSHLKLLLLDILKLEQTKKTLKGNPSVDSSFLETHKATYPWIEQLLEYKELKKLTGTYLNGLLDRQEGGFIHASFNMAGTTTGRFSSSNPNLQNLPKHGGVKSLFVPRPGCKFIYADYSQLELRVAAALSQEPILLQAYREGQDLHKQTASVIFNKDLADVLPDERDKAKRINFAIIYNASGWRIAEIMGWMDGVPLCSENGQQGYKCKCAGCTARKDAARKGDKIIESLFGKYKTLKKYLDAQKEFMVTYALSVSSFGKFRRLTGLKSEVKSEFNHAIKAGFNLPIQSFGASLCKRSMVKLWNEGYRIINQIHDSILVEVPDYGVLGKMKHMKHVMESIHDIGIPLLVEPKILDSFEEK